MSTLDEGRHHDLALTNAYTHPRPDSFEVTTLGQPLEVTKTTMAANRSLTMAQALKEVWSRGGVMGYYQGVSAACHPRKGRDPQLTLPLSLPLARSQLIPWAWIEASTKGAVLLFTAAEIEKTAVKSGIGAGSAGLLGGMGGGIAQAYATMGFCTCMKT